MLTWAAQVALSPPPERTRQRFRAPQRSGWIGRLAPYANDEQD